MGTVLVPPLSKIRQISGGHSDEFKKVTTLTLCSGVGLLLFSIIDNHHDYSKEAGEPSEATEKVHFFGGSF
jgi:hypothetical protein